MTFKLNGLKKVQGDTSCLCSLTGGMCVGLNSLNIFFFPFLYRIATYLNAGGEKSASFVSPCVCKASCDNVSCVHPGP